MWASVERDKCHAQLSNTSSDGCLLLSAWRSHVLVLPHSPTHATGAASGMAPFIWKAFVSLKSSTRQQAGLQTGRIQALCSFALGHWLRLLSLVRPTTCTRRCYHVAPGRTQWGRAKGVLDFIPLIREMLSSLPPSGWAIEAVVNAVIICITRFLLLLSTKNV
ncbi:unnamed protein product [Protopolystoma xenopodis]|uniref:Uncharacterized protein n=1 Tax=Protopolystoma xenopodis TaxID=117903 RepID=A0A3S5AKN0_9PLAT|nr:unnamed protein product [Protopolystoma xenopodis]